jgi:hypothetical protein
MRWYHGNRVVRTEDLRCRVSRPPGTGLTSPAAGRAPSAVPARPAGYDVTLYFGLTDVVGVGRVDQVKLSFATAPPAFS